MSLYEGIMQGLTEALAYTNGEIPAKVDRYALASVPEFTPGDVKQIRVAANMTQWMFAAVIGVSKKSVEAWEGGRSKPDGAARRMLGLLQSDPMFADRMGLVTRPDTNKK